MGKRRKCIVDQTCPDCEEFLYSSMSKEKSPKGYGYVCRKCNKHIYLDEEPRFRSDMIRLRVAYAEQLRKDGDKKTLLGMEVD